MLKVDGSNPSADADFFYDRGIVINLKITKIYVGIQNNKYMGIQIKFSNYRTHTAVWKFVLKYALPLVFRSMTSIEVS